MFDGPRTWIVICPASTAGKNSWPMNRAVTSDSRNRIAIPPRTANRCRRAIVSRTAYPRPKKSMNALMRP